MKRNDLIAALALLAFGLATSIGAMCYAVGTLRKPGPGLFPLVLGCLLVLFSVVLVAQAISRHPVSKEAAGRFFEAGGLKKLSFTLISIIAAIFLFERVGYLLTIFLLTVFLMFGVGHQTWKRTLLTAFLTAAGVYLVFVLLLEQQLPAGILGF